MGYIYNNNNIIISNFERNWNGSPLYLFSEVYIKREGIPKNHSRIHNNNRIKKK